MGVNLLQNRRRMIVAAQPHLETANGDIVSFGKGVAVPMKRCEVGIEPVQDLHGYDSPWPAGGGKNLLDFTKVSARSGIYYGISVAKGTEEGTFILSGTLEHTGSVAPIEYADNSLSGKGYVFLTEHISGDSLVRLGNTYGLRTESEKAIAVYLNGTVGTAYTETIRISVYEQSAPTTWSPYSNICPITGWTGAKVYRTGKNLLNLTMDDIESTQRATTTITNGIVTVEAADTYARTMFHAKVQTGKEYSFGFIGSGTGDYNYFFIRSTPEWSVTGTYMTRRLTSTETWYSVRFTALSDDLYIAIYVTTNATTGSIVLSDIQLEPGSTATPYEPYTGKTVDVQFPSEAGTVYGGTLDVTNGTLSVETVYREFDGSSDESWSETGASGTTSQVFLLPWADVRGATFGGKTIICNQALETDSLGDPAYGFCKNSSVQYYNIRVNIMPTAVLLTEFRAYLSQHPLQIVCPLVTPLTYQLTPQQINTLRGENHIWSDAGNISATYYTI